MRVNCLIIDDEPLAVEVIKSHVDKLDSLNVVATCHRAADAFELLRSKKIDLLFLDIQMPGLTGLEFLRSLRNPPKVILTTAYKEYALEGYELDIVDYLMKPISFERFIKAVNKFFEQQPRDIELHHSKSNGDDNDFMYIRTGKMVHKVLLKDIVFVESLKDYVNIHTADRTIHARQTLSSIENMLNENHFMRIHRSFIVSIHHISGFTATTIAIADKNLPIGRNYKQQVFHQLNYTPGDE
ncbi:LytTR family DNA-binding domain-containing protein [Carboxylicivirga sp. M1479]|uniref:LytR/AlgR family response regulator transcription factor n=1 Tax=Carboxylicivirga sp. M1479 TaxID=2594476 RepID=UPI0011785442|nr:LytTR family DNA-binding domain-containing protein [Carboxylicivirga sp. M1479]TRX65826.1 response regulator transcription factor [Carboxylicivirga sp. M1479]